MRLNRLFVLMLLAACDGDPAGIDRGDLLLTAEVDAGVQAPAVNVHFQVRNRGDRALWVWDQCGGDFAPYVDRHDDGRWVDVSSQMCFAALQAPIQLEPGESVEGALAIYEPGRYRFRVGVMANPEDVQAESMHHEFTIAD